MKKVLMVIAAIMLLMACNKQTPKPKPLGYMRINFPEHKYVIFDSVGFPYTFEIPVYSRIEQDKDPNTKPYWINVYFPQYKARIHLTYYHIHDNLDTMLDDSHILVYKHTVKADNITASDFTNDSLRVYATLFTLEGNAATPYQFHITDSTNNFLRGALYFNTRPHYDSLYPYIKFLKKDITHLIETLEWKNASDKTNR